MSPLNRTVQILILTGLASASLVSSGCKAVGDAIIPHHPASYVKEGCTTSIQFEKEGGAQNGDRNKIMESAIGIAAGVLIDQTSKAVEIESKKYTAVYSARHSDMWYDGAGFKNKIRFSRKMNAEEIFHSDFLFDMDMTNWVFRIVPTNVVIRKVASKVFSPDFNNEGWRIWQWPADLVWCVWTGCLQDNTISEVDFNIRVVIEAVVWDTAINEGDRVTRVTTNTTVKSDGSVTTNATTEVVVTRPERSVDFNKTLTGGKSILLCALDFPVGKCDFKSVSGSPEYDGKKLRELISGYMPLPVPDTTKINCLPVNITVTVTEGNDLGDIIGKGATELAKNKDSIVKQIVEAVGKK